MIHKSLAFIAVAMAAAGCSTLSTDLPPLQPISIVTLRSIPNDVSPSRFTAKAYAYFFSERGFSYSDSRFASNTCVGPQLIGSGGSTPARWLDPGSPTTLTLQGAPGVAPRTQQLSKGVDQSDANVYTNAVNPTLYPGADTAVITVPGAAGGFPAITVRGRTVEDFTFEPVADSSTGAGGLLVKWSAATLPNSAMEIALVYAGSASSTKIDTQLVCTVVDDGDFSIPRQFLDGWQQAGDDSRPLQHEVHYTRYLTSAVTAGDATILLLNSLDKSQIK